MHDWELNELYDRLTFNESERRRTEEIIVSCCAAIYHGDMQHMHRYKLRIALEQQDMYREDTKRTKARIEEMEAAELTQPEDE